MRKFSILFAILLLVGGLAPANDANALLNAVRGEEYGTLAKLIEARVDMNAKDYEGITALMLAAAMGNGKLVAVLIIAGVDVNARNNEGTTALMLAVAMGHTDIAGLLIKAGTSVSGVARTQ